MVDRRQPPQRRPRSGRSQRQPQEQSPATRRRLAAQKPKNNNQMLIIGGAAGGLLLLIIIIAVAASGGSEEPYSDNTPEKEPDKPVKRENPRVLQLEKSAKEKCEAALKDGKGLKGSLKNISAERKEELRGQFKDVIKRLDAGIRIYKEAERIGTKTYTIKPYERLRAELVHECTIDLQVEGQRLCDEGLKLFQSTESMMTGKELSDAEKKMLREKLTESRRLISAGMNLYDEANQIGGAQFETRPYTKAFKAASLKLGELGD